MLMPFERVVGDSSKDHTVTAFTSATTCATTVGYTTMRDSTQRVGAIRLHPISVRDRLLQPSVVGLAGELENPARHRHGYPVSGELCHERVEPFPGRWACPKYAAARRSTSTSCSSSRLR